MSQTRSRWVINIILVLAVIGFVGFSMIPLITQALKDSRPSTATTSEPRQVSSSDGQKSKLADQARGYESVLQREPENQTALKGLLQARLELLRMGEGDIKGVLPPLEKLAKLNPQQTEYTILLAQAKQQTGDREGAAEAYRSILKTKPGDSRALAGMVGLLMQQKRPEAAIGLLQDTLSTSAQANKIQPGSVNPTDVRLLLGMVYAQDKRYDQALTVYDQAIKDSKQDFRPLLAKALVLKQQGNTEQAKPLFADAVALAPAKFKDQINQLANQPPIPDNTTTPSAPKTSNSEVPATTPSPKISSSETPTETPSSKADTKSDPKEDRN